MRVEFIDARFERPVGFATDVNHSFRTDLRTFYKFGQFVDLFAGICGASFSTDGADIFGRVEYAETFTLCQRGDIVECHSEADVGLIRTVEFHCVGPRHTRELFGHVDAENVFEQVFGHSFEQLQHVVAIDERHLAVDLCEFGLTVGPQVLVAEAAHDLEITVIARDHQQLLERLRRLRQRVELPRIHA